MNLLPTIILSMVIIALRIAQVYRHINNYFHNWEKHTIRQHTSSISALMNAVDFELHHFGE